MSGRLAGKVCVITGTGGSMGRATAWGELVLGDGSQIITQNFFRYPVMRMQSVPRSACC